MEIIGAAALVAGALVAVAWLLVRNGGLSGGSASTAERDEQARLLGERQAELARLEERLNARASELDRRETEQDRREDVLAAQHDKLTEREGRDRPGARARVRHERRPGAQDASGGGP